MSWVGVAIGGGMALGGGASFLGAQSQNQAGNRAVRSQREDAELAQQRLGTLMMGQGGYADFTAATSPRRVRNGVTEFWTRQAGWQPDNGASGRFSSAYPDYQSVLSSALPQFVRDMEGNQAQESRNSQQLDRMATQNEEAGQDLVRQQTQRIRRDSGRRLAGLNQQSDAALGMLGPSTLTSNARTANTRQVGEDEDDAILNAALGGLDRFQSGRRTRMGLMSGRMALEGELGRTVAGARRDASLAPAEAMQGLGGMPQFNPRINYAFAGQSPAGSALGSIGSGLTGLGAALAMQQGGGGGQAGGGAWNGGQVSRGGGGGDVWGWGYPRFR